MTLGSRTANTHRLVGPKHQAADMTQPSNGQPTWDGFADHVLPYVGSSSLGEQIQRVAPGLTPKMRAAWVSRFNEANTEHSARFADELDDWTDEEIDGLWYDEMKAIALACISEAHLNSPRP